MKEHRLPQNKELRSKVDIIFDRVEFLNDKNNDIDKTLVKFITILDNSVDEIKDLKNNIDFNIEKINHVIFGNGNVGIKTEIMILKEDFNNLKEQINLSKKNSMHILSTVIASVGAISGILTFILNK